MRFEAKETKEKEESGSINNKRLETKGRLKGSSRERFQRVLKEKTRLGDGDFRDVKMEINFYF